MEDRKGEGVFDLGEVVVLGARKRQLSPWRLGSASGGRRVGSQSDAMVMPLGSRLGNSELAHPQGQDFSLRLAVVNFGTRGPVAAMVDINT